MKGENICRRDIRRRRPCGARGDKAAERQAVRAAAFPLASLSFQGLQFPSKTPSKNFHRFQKVAEIFADRDLSRGYGRMKGENICRRDIRRRRPCGARGDKAAERQAVRAAAFPFASFSFQGLQFPSKTPSKNFHRFQKLQKISADRDLSRGYGRMKGEIICRRDIRRRRPSATLGDRRRSGRLGRRRRALGLWSSRSIALMNGGSPGSRPSPAFRPRPSRRSPAGRSAGRRRRPRRPAPSALPHRRRSARPAAAKAHPRARRRGRPSLAHALQHSPRLRRPGEPRAGAASPRVHAVLARRGLFA